ncbi:MAG: aminotransferase class V-fold PLP-dependent enzyme [Gemmatimonadota bacterium]|nr:aminotransferase class V-fold PLP-dependent enzyme [Gemmatimonadota bacterium]
MASPSYDLGRVRAEIPILQTHIPLNNCSQAPQSLRTRSAAEAYLASWNEAGMDWDTWIGETEAARGEFAALISADPEDVAVATSVSQATASVATGLDYSGDRCRVVASGAEFPTVGHVWLAQERFGARVEWVPVRDGRVELGDYEDVIDDRTLIVSACRGYYQTGFKQDIGEISRIAHDAGALLYVDAYQTLGSEPFDAPASGADFVTSGNLKFLMGIPGIAFLWVRPGLADGLRPAVTGWFGREDPFAFDATRLDWGAGARRLDLGTPPILEAYVARAGMGWLRELGLDAIGAWTSLLGQRCVEGAVDRGLRVLGPTDPALKAPTTAILCEKSREVESALRTVNVIASARGPVIRLAPHFYNSVEDIDRALDALAAAVRKAA